MLKKFVLSLVSISIILNTLVLYPKVDAKAVGTYTLRLAQSAEVKGITLDNTTTTDDDDFGLRISLRGEVYTGKLVKDLWGVLAPNSWKESAKFDLSQLGNSFDYLEYVLFLDNYTQLSYEADSITYDETTNEYKQSRDHYLRPGFFDISDKGIDKLFNEKFGTTSTIQKTNKDSIITFFPLNIVDTSAYLSDYFTLMMLTKFQEEKSTLSYNELVTFTNRLNKMSTSRIYSENLLRVASTIADKEVQSIQGIKDYILSDLKSNEEDIIMNIGSGKLETAYIKPIIESKMLSSSTSTTYQKYKAMLYALTTNVTDESVKTALYSNIESYIGNVGTKILFVIENSDREVLLNKVLTKMKSVYVSGDKTHYSRLISIVEQRASSNSTGSSNPFARREAGLSFSNQTDMNASIKAKDVLNSMEALLSAYANSNTEDVKQMYSINYRVQYHYWAMQADTLGTSSADLLSTSTLGNLYYREIEPLSISSSMLVNLTQYNNLMNTINEIPSMRALFLEELAGDVFSNISLTSKLIDQVLYLRQLKSAIEFLQSIDSSSFDVSPVVNYWYEKVEVKDLNTTMSLEDLYNRVQELDIVPNTANPYETGEDVKPLSYFFDLTTKDINDSLKMGIAQSATYVPLKTNVYEASTYRNIKSDNFYKFHYQWGYYRKALYIDTNLKSAVDYYINGKKGSLKVATLNDLFQPEKDITLYIDDNMYNVNQLAEMQNKTLDRLDNQGTSSNTSFWGRVWDWTTQIFSISVLEITKTSEVDKYSKSLRGITSYEKSTSEDFMVNVNDDVSTSKNYAVLGKEGIDKYLAPIEDDTDNPGNFKNEGDYSVVQPFAFVSAVYRDTTLFDFLNNNIQKPVFVSSSDLYSARQATESDKNSIFNYALLKNIKANQVISYMSNLDKNSPLYMDIYGNILTESGYVVIPAASNATLHKEYNPYTTAFLSTYGEIYKLPTTYKGLGITDSSSESFTTILHESEDKDVWEFPNISVGFDSKVDINRLSVGSSTSMDTLYKIYYLQLGDILNKDLYISNVFMEVVRGAPIENINKEFEGLNTGMSISRAGIVNGVKLDKLKDSLEMNSQNAVLALPNLAFSDKIEYVILMVYKLTMIIVILLILVQIFVSAMKQQFGLKAVLNIITTIAITLAAVFTVPTIFSLTYYQANKLLLQNETAYIAMLNYEKDEAGVEIGMMSVGAPVSETQLLVKVQDLNIPWYDLVYKIIYAPVGSNLQNIYIEEASNNLAIKEEDFTLLARSLYMDMRTLLDSSYVLFDASFESDFATLYQTTKGNLPASFYTPYYVFLDALIGNVNIYNSKNNVYSYTTAMYQGSKTKSLGLIKEYFTSDEFAMDKTGDILRLRSIYGLDINSQEETIFDTNDIDTMRQSQWLDITHPTKDVTPRVDKLNEEARVFILDNKDLLGKISDETFLKMMALHLSMYHNKLFGVDSFDSIEIYNLSTDDLTRLSVAPRDTVMEGSPLSYTRFIYNLSGEVGIYLSAIYSIITYASGWLKPIVTLIMFLVVFFSFFVYKIILRRKSDNVMGYLKVFGLLCMANVLYAGLMKVSMLLPNLFGPALCLLIQIVLQLLFLCLYLFIALMSINNWRDLGSAYLSATAQNIKDFFNNTIASKVNKGLKEEGEDETSGWRKYKLMKDKDKARKYTLKGRRDI